MRRAWLTFLLIVAGLSGGDAAPKLLQLSLRSRVEAFRGSGEWKPAQVEERLPIGQSALILCDLWDRHWCQAAEERTAVLARRTAPLVELARLRGMLVIHAPSSTMGFYRDAPARLRVSLIPKVEPPPNHSVPEPPLPIDDSDGGCDTPNNPLAVHTPVWTRQHSAIRVADGDLVSDDGREVYSALRQRGVTTLFVAGVHTNMCVLNRSFAIRQMTKWGIRCVLIRDLTDAMYNPVRRPFVSHEDGTQLVIEHIERHWAPTIESAQLTVALRAQ